MSRSQRIPTDNLETELKRLAGEVGREPPIDQYASIPQDALVAELQRLADKLGTIPTAGDMNEHGKYSTSTYVRRFEGWNAAIASLMHSWALDTLSAAVDTITTRHDRVPNVDSLTAPSRPTEEGHTQASEQTRRAAFHLGTADHSNSTSNSGAATDGAGEDETDTAAAHLQQFIDEKSAVGQPGWNQFVAEAVAAIIIVGCREHAVPVTNSEMQECVSASVSPAIDSSRVNSRKQEIDQRRGKWTEPVAPEHFIRRFAAECNLSQSTVDRALGALDDVAPSQHSGPSRPDLTAAAALYVGASHPHTPETETLTQSEVATHCGVASAQIRARVNS